MGRATARRLAKEGATVVGVDLVEHAVGERCLQADVTDEAQVRDLYARVRDELGRIDVLFNNAGVNDPDDGSALDISLETLGPRADGEPHERVLVLQARDPAPAGQRPYGRLGDQHGDVLGGHGRGDLTDGL
jgi:NAD(P)-dependent dehydrogenase (short-subunit alcohol dehydrogenase family)